MSDELKKHRVIGIRHTLKKIKDAGLISGGAKYPVDAVEELQKTKKKAESAKRHRTARSDAPIDSIVKAIEETFKLPEGSVKLQYPSGRKARSDTTINQLRKKWDSD
jgi:predicted MarR family transcription regulator